MKKTLLVGMLLFLSTTAVLAQNFAIDQGAVIITGTAVFKSQGGDLYKDQAGNAFTTLTIAPAAWYFVAPNIGIGGNLAFNRTSQGDSQTSSFGIGPSAGYFFGNSASTSIPFLGVGFNYSGNSSWNDVKSSTTDIIIGAGLICPVKKYIGITFIADYHMQSWKLKDANTSISGSVFAVGVGIVGLIF